MSLTTENREQRGYIEELEKAIRDINEAVSAEENIGIECYLSGEEEYDITRSIVTYILERGE